MGIHKSGEDYLEAILILKLRKGFVRAVDVANELGFSRPSVSKALALLKSEGYITIGGGSPRSNGIFLTEAGEERALSVYDRHRTIRAFLRDVLGMSEENAEQDACKIEHVISGEAWQRLKIFMSTAGRTPRADSGLK